MFAGTPDVAGLAGAGAELAGAGAELAGAGADVAADDGAAAALVVAGAGADEAGGVADFFELLHAVATNANAVMASTAEVLRLRAVMRIILFPSNVVTVPGRAGLFGLWCGDFIAVVPHERVSDALPRYCSGRRH
jgi:hypothetical protein